MITDFFNFPDIQQEIASASAPVDPKQLPVTGVQLPQKRSLPTGDICDDGELQDALSGVCGGGEEAKPPHAKIKATEAGSIHRRYSAAQKAKAVEYSRIHGLRAAERRYGIHRRNIQRWTDDADADSTTTKKHSSANKPGQGRKLSYPRELDLEVAQWFISKRDVQDHVSTEVLKQKAKEVICPSTPNFKASDGWCQKFLRRNNLCLQTRVYTGKKKKDKTNKAQVPEPVS